MKYQPYRDYFRKPWLRWHAGGYGKRVRTRSDWQWYTLPYEDHRFHHSRIRYEVCTLCNKTHCVYCRCYQPWKRDSHDSDTTAYAKKIAHRGFRRLAKRAIASELADHPVSHAFKYHGDYID